MVTMKPYTPVIIAAAFFLTAEAFAPWTLPSVKIENHAKLVSPCSDIPYSPRGHSTVALRSTPTDTNSISSTTQESVEKLKKVLEREYVSFFDPMYTEYYAPDVTFDDPLNDLDGVAAYQANVDMLGGRTTFGSLLFQDSSIVLHSVKGGEVKEDGSISDITTRWTLRFTFKILPWQPTARFTGISVYNVEQGGSQGVLVKKQTDYWDSINMIEGGEYRQVEKGIAISDFVNQLLPGGIQAQGAAPEVPYQLLRRGNGYEVRQYPSYTTVKIPYGRRDEGFGALGAFTKGMNPLSPAIMEVQDDETADKTMMWPLSFAAPGQETPPNVKKAIEKSSDGQWSKCEITTIPSQVVAVAEFTDASMEPVVRRAIDN
jgi:hypothetical protein